MTIAVIDPEKFRSVPFAHQLEGIKKLVQHKSFALFDEMGAGKSKQVIDAACVLAEAGKINAVVVLTPASVRSVWTNTDIGEVRKHCWLPSSVHEYHAKVCTVWSDKAARLAWIVTNYEFLRNAQHLERLIALLAQYKVMLVLDESSYIKSRTAAQTKAAAKLREACLRAVLLNGTPITLNPLDLWGQFMVLDASILKARYHNFYYFRSEYAEMGGWHNKQVVRWRRLDRLQSILAPYVLRRLKKDCLDLPPKLFTQREVALTPESWARYKELREEAILALSAEDRRMEPNTASRVLRLCQLTSGHVGHLGAPAVERVAEGTMPNGRELFSALPTDETLLPGVTDTSSEKLDWAVEYLSSAECTAMYVIVWCRWRRERERLKELFLQKNNYACRRVVEIYGSQKSAERLEALAVFGGQRGDLPSVLIAQPQAGGFGLNLTKATEVIYLSNDWNLGMRLQSEDRCHRPGQTHPVTYIDVLATGPRGQKTVDHTVVKALRKKQDLAEMTTSAWRRELEEEF